jgi:8-amino-7-oxononanoate synthase
VGFIDRFGSSTSSSRLLLDNNIYSELENLISKTYNKESCLIFPSGYQLNNSVIKCLISHISQEKKIVIFSDELNHASIYDAIDIRKCKLERYSNINLLELENALMKYQDSDIIKIVITETIFSMDGTIADIPQILKLKKQHNFILYVDDAHGIGVYGGNGYGLCEGLDGVDIIVGTFSKALASQGGYIVCNEILSQFLINFCKGFIYSTGLNPFSLGCALASWKLLPFLTRERLKLCETMEYVKSSLRNRGYSKSYSHIIPIIIGDNEKLDKIHEYLLKNNILTSKIKSPTVPVGNEMLRICLNVGHTKADIDLLFEYIDKYSNESQL